MDPRHQDLSSKERLPELEAASECINQEITASTTTTDAFRLTYHEHQYLSAFSTMHLPSSTDLVSDKALRMMEKMGYKSGTGLGKNEQGITESVKINMNLGTRGLGLDLGELNLSDESWDFSQEDIEVAEKVHWLENRSETDFSEENLDEWLKMGPRNENVMENSNFCDREVLENVFNAKNIFDELNLIELNQARARANPFETIRSSFFMNRAALKMANIDAACDFMFTSMEEHKQMETPDCSPIYFADVCAGPGGFSEYILWRKGWFYKGFGLTLKDEHDFKISESTCATGVPFQALYGADGRGDVYNPENLTYFTDRVMNETDGEGVHFMMSDGGFCVDGQENLQEVLSKNIYICQCLLALNILRPHGNFVTKTFDIFTPFSVGLLYLVYLCFEKVAILKPNSSRPANSERYFICSNFKVHPQTNLIRKYLWRIVMRLWEIGTLPDRDVVEIVPLDILEKDQNFFQYIRKSNASIGKRQIIALKKLAQFCRNPSLVERRQELLRKQCLEYWKIPDEKRKPVEIYRVDDVLLQMYMAQEILRVQPRRVNSRSNLESTISNPNDWHYCYLFSSEAVNRTNFYAGIGFSKVYRLQNNRWVKVKDLQLVKGTLLYGEFVKETIHADDGQVSTRYSLHVIDAVFLGAVDLQGFTFQERMKYIQVFCKAVNRESQSEYSVRVRPKELELLTDLPRNLSLYKKDDSQTFSKSLPRIGFKSVSEKYDVNSILLLKTNAAQTFQSTHALRVQIFDAKEQINISFEELTKSIDDLMT